MAVDINLIKEIREATDLPFGQISKALAEAGGDREKAMELLKAQGALVAAKKSERATGEGVVASYIHATKKIGALAEVLCETDFVARNPVFIELAQDIAMQVAAMNPETVDDLLQQTFIKDESLTVQALIHGAVAKLGENIKLNRFTRFSI